MEIYDTTLRDGTQNQDLNLNVRDKVEFALSLDDFGVDYIELGWPGSNQKDMEAFKEMSKRNLKSAKVCAFGATKKKGTSAEKDVNLNAIVQSKAPVGTIFGKTWLLHVEKQLGMTASQNLEAIRESVEFLKQNNVEVVYDAEHFFDGYKDSKDYALKCLKEAAVGGADFLVLCDTNGGMFTNEMRKVVQEVEEFLGKNDLEVNVGIHCHNDRELAVSNTLEVSDLVQQVQGTINGFGERTGNANLCSVLPALKSMGVEFKAAKNLRKLTSLSRYLFTLANVRPYKSQPYVGKNAFAHKGGIHVDAVSKGATYEFMKPEDVGNARNTVLSDLSGKANVVEMAKKFGYVLGKSDEGVERMLKEIKNMEKNGYDINGLEAEQYLLLQKFLNGNRDFIDVDFFEVRSFGRKSTKSNCFIRAEIENEDLEYELSVTGGPVDALYHALQNLLKQKYPEIENVKLLNYKVRIAEQKGVSSSVRVYAEFHVGRNGKKYEWATVGVNENILIASLEAVKKGFEYYFMRVEKKAKPLVKP